MMGDELYRCPRIVLSGLSGGSGKTVATLGLIETWRRQGLAVAPFKKGPDYIDAAWHTLAAGRRSRNLDTFLMEPNDILRSLQTHGSRADIAVVEGARGLYDGMDVEGTHSTAELAKLIDAPVILIVDCTKATRTVAALVLGCKMMDKHVDIAGVILNRVANIRQETLISKAVEKETGTPVLGAIPRMKGISFSERHLGLLPPQEHPQATEALDTLSDTIRDNVDAGAILEIARSSPELARRPDMDVAMKPAREPGPRIGVFRDSAFTFYYPENLEALQRCGAELVEINSMEDETLPPIDALYIGGGFPETHAEKLAANASFRRSVRERVEDGLPVYAECGGLIYLGDTIELGGKSYPMAGVFPATYSVEEKPQGHGYVVAEIDKPNPFFRRGTIIRGHEFHYARVCGYDPEEIGTAFNVRRGVGFDGGRDGLVHKNVFASFCHIHALGEKGWAKAFVDVASRRRVAGAATSSKVSASRQRELKSSAVQSY
jgi:cobyrinic acid a,c-diamide synthase